MSLKTELSNASPHEKLDGFFSIGVETQRRIGTFVVLCSMLEMQVEAAAITLKGELKPGERIWTDGKNTSDLIVAAMKLLHKIDHKEHQEITRLTLQAVNDLFTIRHTVVHGIPIGATSTEGAALARNRSRFGEVRRREQSQVAADDELLDRAAAIADQLFMTLGQSMSALTGSVPLDLVLSGESRLHEAVAQAAEMKDRALSLPAEQKPA